MRILVVCLGNICRSPMGEGVLRALAEKAGKDWTIDSAGTYGGHAGEAPDHRAQAAMRKMGYNIEALRARQVRREDFEHFDWILAMDRQNLQDLKELQGTDWDKVLPFMPDGTEVPDPYWGEAADFDSVRAMLQQGGESWLQLGFPER